MSEKRPQFGNRYLTEKDDVFKHNAWDDVEWDEQQEEVQCENLVLPILSHKFRYAPMLIFMFFQHAKKMVEANSTCNFSSEEIEKLKVEADQKWDKFYGIHQNR